MPTTPEIMVCPTIVEIGGSLNYLRPLVEAGTGRERTAIAYLAAVKE